MACFSNFGAPLLLPPAQRENVDTILEHLCDPGVQVYGRLGGNFTGFLPTEQLKANAECMQKRMQGNTEPQTEDLKFDEEVVKKITAKLEKMQEEEPVILSHDKSVKHEQTAESLEELREADAKAARKAAQKERLAWRLKAGAAMRCKGYAASIFASVAKHQESLQRLGEAAIKGLRKAGTPLTPAQEEELRSNLKLHDWSKLYMPASFAGSIYDPDLEMTLADFQDDTDPALQAFFACVVIHNLLEGSTLTGHHLNSLGLLGSSEASLAILTCLLNGPTSLVRIIEGILDGFQACVSERIISVKSADNSKDEKPIAENKWLKHHFQNLAPGTKHGLSEEIFVARMRLVLGETDLLSFAECRDAASYGDGADSQLLTTEMLMEKSVFFRTLVESV